MLDAKAEGDHSCDNVCKDEGGTCDQPEIDKLKTADDVKAAFKKALNGYECANVNTGCEKGKNCERWGSPFVHKDAYKHKTCSFGEWWAWCVLCGGRGASPVVCGVVRLAARTPGREGTCRGGTPNHIPAVAPRGGVAQ